MRIEKLKNQRYSYRCDQGCMKGSGQTYLPRLATHRMWIIGRETLVCPSCMPGMKAAWENALNGWSDEQVAA